MAFENIFTHGNLVDVNVGMWTAERKLQPEDLGLEGENISEVFSLGHKKLMPTEVIAKFRHMDYQARNTLERFSFSFEFGSARFVPKKRFMEFAAEIDKVIADFQKVADEFTANYDRYRLEMRQQFVQAGYEAYDRLRALNGFRKNKDCFINEFIERVDKYYPPASDIRNRFHMEYTVFQVALPDLSQASYADLAEEGEKIKLMQAAYQKSLSRKVESFVDRIATEQRAKAQEVLQHLSDHMKANRKVSESSLAMIRNMIEEYEKMDIIGDTGFLGMLKKFKERMIDRYSAQDVRENKYLARNIMDELALLMSAAADKAVIQELTKNYRERISL
jgi:hypothetical protein